jgi:hypothetical protein
MKDQPASHAYGQPRPTPFVFCTIMDPNLPSGPPDLRPPPPFYNLKDFTGRTWKRKLLLNKRNGRHKKRLFCKRSSNFVLLVHQCKSSTHVCKIYDVDFPSPDCKVAMRMRRWMTAYCLAKALPRSPRKHALHHLPRVLWVLRQWVCQPSKGQG